MIKTLRTQQSFFIFIGKEQNNIKNYIRQQLFCCETKFNIEVKNISKLLAI